MLLVRYKERIHRVRATGKDLLVEARWHFGPFQVRFTDLTELIRPKTVRKRLEPTC